MGGSPFQFLSILSTSLSHFYEVPLKGALSLGSYPAPATRSCPRFLCSLPLLCPAQTSPLQVNPLGLASGAASSRQSSRTLPDWVRAYSLDAHSILLLSFTLVLVILSCIHICFSMRLCSLESGTLFFFCLTSELVQACHTQVQVQFLFPSFLLLSQHRQAHSLFVEEIP